MLSSLPITHLMLHSELGIVGSDWKVYKKQTKRIFRRKYWMNTFVHQGFFCIPLYNMK